MKKFLYLILTASLLLSSCAALQTPALTVMTHDSFSISTSVIEGFEKANNVKVEFVKSGDVGELVNRAILTKSAPVADVLYGVDNTFLFRALSEGLFEPYQSPLLVNVPEDLQLDSTHSATPIDYGDVCVNYDVAYFQSKNLPVPQSLEDLAEPLYRDMLIVENPATSSPGLAFLVATISRFGLSGYIPYWVSLRENGVLVADTWENAYYTFFSGSSGKGSRPLVVSYSTSPAAEVFFSATPIDSPPTGSITTPGSCFRQVEFAGILKGTDQTELAQKFINYMLSVPFQSDLALQMFVYPAVLNVDLPDLYLRHVTSAEDPAYMTPQQIDLGRKTWIRFWNDAVMR